MPQQPGMTPRCGGLFPEHPPHIVVDLETTSEVDLFAVSTYAYSIHPTTRVLVLGMVIPIPFQDAWKRLAVQHGLAPIPTEQTILYRPDGHPTRTDDTTRDFCKLAAIASKEGWYTTAHNAHFEECLWPKTKLNTICWEWSKLQYVQWDCTMSRGRMMGFPGGLDRMGEILGLAQRKDVGPNGKAFMQQMAKPLDITHHGQQSIFGSDPKWEHHNQTNLLTLAGYCLQDCRTTAELSLALPWWPNEFEYAAWRACLEGNRDGITFDRTLGQWLEFWSACSRADWGRQVEAATNGQVTANDLNRTGYLANYCGIDGDALDKAAVAQALESNTKLSPAARTVLLARRTTAKTSAAKYSTMIAMSEADGRVHDGMEYYGTGNGRFSGKGYQPHNFPRETLPESEINHLLALFPFDPARQAVIPPQWSEADFSELRLIRALFDDPILLASRCLRGSLIARKGHDLIGADYSQIEARIVMWLAQEPGIRIFSSGRDPYKVVAGMIHDLSEDQVTKKMRDEDGKPGVLGPGFGMGVDSAMRKYGFGLEKAQRIINTYRENFPAVPILWKNIERAAINACHAPGTWSAVKGARRTLFFHDGRDLWMKLPSEALICYFKAKVEERMVDKRRYENITYWGLNMGDSGTSKQWGPETTYGGKLTQNAVSRLARDVMVIGWLNIKNTPWNEKPCYRVDYVPLTIHDELLAETPESTRETLTPEEFCRIMLSNLPAWCQDIPLKASGWRGKRFRK